MKKERGNILENIEEIRKRKGLTQASLAEKIGMKQAGFGLIETGERKLQYDVLLQIAVALEMDIIDIITHPEFYTNQEKSSTTRVVVELDVSNDEFIKLGLKDKVLQILDK